MNHQRVQSKRNCNGRFARVGIFGKGREGLKNNEKNSFQCPEPFLLKEIRPCMALAQVEMAAEDWSKLAVQESSRFIL
jgi:hypothetical protein